MFFERRIVDNRTFLLGLDGLYRESLKQHERGELLSCARKVAAAVAVAPADVPVEGYYAEDPQLTEYFRLMRSLQNVDVGVKSAVTTLPEFVRLLDVTSAPLYGRPQEGGKLLPVGRDALSEALVRNRPNWTLSGLCTTAAASARELDDCSLVGLAARVGESVVVAAVRESVVLYAETIPLAALISWKRSPRYVWKVDDDLTKNAKRFVDAFNALFAEELPTPHRDHAERYWHACHRNDVLGRCVRLGSDDEGRQYHWAIRQRTGGVAGLEVHEFWDATIWTTDMYRARLGIARGRSQRHDRDRSGSSKAAG